MTTTNRRPLVVHEFSKRGKEVLLRLVHLHISFLVLSYHKFRKMATEASAAETFRPLMVNEKEEPPSNGLSPVMVSKQEAPVQAVIIGTTPAVVVQTSPVRPPPTVAPPQVDQSPTVNPPMALIEGAMPPLGQPSAVYYDGESPQLNQQRDNYRSRAAVGLSCFRFGRLQFSGEDVVPEKITQVMILHGSNLDLTHAQFIFKDTFIRVVVLLGGCNIVVPPGVHVIMKGIAICGANDEENLSIPPISASQPTLHIEAVCVFGSVRAQTDPSAPWINKLN